MEKFDVIVAGGGFAGAAAAIAAARCGQRVLLFDKSNCLGGAAVNCLVNPFMSYSTRVNDEVKDLSAGLFAEIMDRLAEMRKLTGEMLYSEKRRIFSEEHLKFVLNQMAIEANVTLLFHAYLCEVKCMDGKIQSLTVATKSGNLELSADYYIDATGDADLAVRSGCSYHLGRETDNLCQPMTLCFRISNVDMEKFNEERPAMQALYKEYKAAGKFKNPREDVLIFRTIQKNVLHFNSTRIVKLNPVNPFDVTRAELEAREQVLELYLFLNEHFAFMKDAELLSTAAEIGVRESRMIDGLHLLTGKELVDCSRFEDSIACGNYDIDIHNPEGSGTSHYYFPAGQYYEIPYRSLLPKEISNLLVAGRCISVDHEAQASIRIMPIVCCLGEAAGVAAAVASKAKVAPADAEIAEIQRILVENGAVIH